MGNTRFASSTYSEVFTLASVSILARFLGDSIVKFDKLSKKALANVEENAGNARGFDSQDPLLEVTRVRPRSSPDVSPSPQTNRLQTNMKRRGDQSLNPSDAKSASVAPSDGGAAAFADLDLTMLPKDVVNRALAFAGAPLTSAANDIIILGTVDSRLELAYIGEYETAELLRVQFATMPDRIFDIVFRKALAAQNPDAFAFETRLQELDIGWWAKGGWWEEEGHRVEREAARSALLREADAAGNLADVLALNRMHRLLYQMEQIHTQEAGAPQTNYQYTITTAQWTRVRNLGKRIFLSAYRLTPRDAILVTKLTEDSFSRVPRTPESMAEVAALLQRYEQRKAVGEIFGLVHFRPWFKYMTQEQILQHFPPKEMSVLNSDELYGYIYYMIQENPSLPVEFIREYARSATLGWDADRLRWLNIRLLESPAFGQLP